MTEYLTTRADQRLARLAPNCSAQTRGLSQTSHPDPHLAGSEEEEPVLGELGVQLAHGREQATHGHRRRALDVVVERAVLVAVLLQETECVMVAEVLKLRARPYGRSVTRIGMYTDEKKKHYVWI